jgi:hypothetical protein
MKSILAVITKTVHLVVIAIPGTVMTPAYRKYVENIPKLTLVISRIVLFDCKCCGKPYILSRREPFVTTGCSPIAMPSAVQCEHYTKKGCTLAGGGCAGKVGGKFSIDDDRNRMRLLVFLITFIWQSLHDFGYCIMNYSTDAVDAANFFLIDGKARVYQPPEKIDFSWTGVIRDDEDDLIVFINQKRSSLKRFPFATVGKAELADFNGVDEWIASVHGGAYFDEMFDAFSHGKFTCRQEWLVF